MMDLIERLPGLLSKTTQGPAKGANRASQRRRPELPPLSGVPPNV